jgi:hypothetical protein
MTLTINTDGLSLKQSLRKLGSAWQKLRRRKRWSELVTGGLAVLEVTYRETTERWHPHLHVLFEGDYFPHSELRPLWLACTGDSFIVDVRSVRNQDEAARYLAKYVGKSVDGSVWRDPDRLREAIAALHGRKLVTAFGGWADLHLTEPPQDDTEWVVVCPADSLLAAIRAGRKDAIELGARLWKRPLLDWLREAEP